MRYKFKYKPYEHQLEALKRSWNKKEFAYFMDMGTGKSKVLIDNMCVLYDRGEITGALIVAPKGVYRNWEQGELPTHIPEHVMYDTVLWNPSQTKTQLEKQNKLYVVDDNLKIFVMNVEAFSTKKGCEAAERFLNAHPSLMVIDESTTIKNKDAKRTKSIVKIGKVAQYRRILTGSPVTKSPMDLFSQCSFLAPTALGYNSYFAFQNRYAVVRQQKMGHRSFQEIVGYRRLDELNERLTGFSTRILKSECLDLPEKLYTKRYVPLTAEQGKLYNQMKDMSLAQLDNGELATTTGVLTQIMRLQQICCGHFTPDIGETGSLDSNRLDELMGITEELQGKCIIWASYTHDIQRIHSDYIFFSFSYARYVFNSFHCIDNII